MPEHLAWVEQTYDGEVLPHSDALMVRGSTGRFALRYPNHPIAAKFRQVAPRRMM
jgi:hypothetical protein